MTVLKRYVLRLFISLKYITANVVDRNNGRIVATASTVEHSIKNSLECGRSCNAKAATVVGEVLAMRLRVDGLEHGQGRGIHVDVNKELQSPGVLAIGSSMKGENSYSHHCTLMLVLLLSTILHFTPLLSSRGNMYENASLSSLFKSYNPSMLMSTAYPYLYQRHLEEILMCVDLFLKLGSLQFKYAENASVPMTFGRGYE